MRDYGKVSPQFWIGETGKKLRAAGPEAQVVALYLMTCPHSNMIGMYYLPVMYMAHETGLGMEGANKGIQRAIEAGFCSYDEASEVVFVHEMAKFQIADELKPTDKRCKGVQNEYDSVPENPFLSMFYEKYSTAYHMSKNRGNSGTSDGGNEAPSKPLASQEQEQEQEYISPEQQEVAQGPKPLFDNPEQEPQALETLTLADKSEHLIFDDDIQQWAEAYPGVDIRGELKRMKAWLNANPRRRKTKRGINAFVVNWLSRQQDNPRPQARSGSQGRVHDDYSSFHHEVAMW